MLDSVTERGVTELHDNIVELIEEGATQAISNAVRFDRSIPIFKRHRAAGLHSVFAVPLKARGQIFGALAIARRQPGAHFGTDDVALLEDLAARATVAIDNARLYHHVQENDRRKNEFLAMLAHELRNPLAPIRSAVEMLQMLEIEDENLHWASDIISRQVDQLVRLVDDLLDISRISGGKIQLRTETVDARSIVARAVEISRPAIDARKHC